VGALLLVPAVRRWASATMGRALRKRRQRRDPTVVDLDPEDWHQISDRPLEDGRRSRKPRATRS
jgi:hypothetical protein